MQFSKYLAKLTVCADIVNTTFLDITWHSWLCVSSTLSHTAEDVISKTENWSHKET